MKNIFPHMYGQVWREHYGKRNEEVTKGAGDRAGEAGRKCIMDMAFTCRMCAEVYLKEKLENDIRGRGNRGCKCTKHEETKYILGAHKCGYDCSAGFVKKKKS